VDNNTRPADPGNEDIALAGALFMVGLGARVLPVAAGTKRALLKDWAKQASDDPDMVMGWAQHHPGCNWAMVCDRVAVLDVDRHPSGPDGHEALAELEAEHGKLETWLVHTPQNGRHYYFSQAMLAITFSCQGRARRMAPIGGTLSFARTMSRAPFCLHTCPPLLPAPKGLANWPTPLERWPVATGRNRPIAGETGLANWPTPLERWPVASTAKPPWPNGSGPTCRKAAVTMR